MPAGRPPFVNLGWPGGWLWAEFRPRPVGYPHLIATRPGRPPDLDADEISGRCVLRLTDRALGEPAGNGGAMIIPENGRSSARTRQFGPADPPLTPPRGVMTPG